jgi:D-alanyl-lipoteichoic acid acyltransferase DltB (MBOAT superfamily)
VGISSIFPRLSYVIDIYLKRIKVEYNFVDYSLFVSYFPLFVAGPIERAPIYCQVKVKRSLTIKSQRRESSVYWGLVKKVVIADTWATYANAIFDNYESMNFFHSY